MDFVIVSVKGLHCSQDKQPHTLKRLLQEKKLDLKKCIDLCRSSEAAFFQIKNISGASSTTDDAHGLKVQPTPPWKQKYDKNAKCHKHQKLKICKFCTGNHPLKKELCPAWQKRCQKCNGRNHFTTFAKRAKRMVCTGFLSNLSLSAMNMMTAMRLVIMNSSPLLQWNHLSMQLN